MHRLIDLKLLFGISHSSTETGLRLQVIVDIGRLNVNGTYLVINSNINIIS